MIKMSLADTLSRAKFKEESKGFRKKLSVLILIIVVIGYICLFGYLGYVSASSSGIRLELKDFEDSQPDNYTLGIDGAVIIKNTHWYSSDITDIDIKMTLYTDDDVKIKSKTIHEDIIPRQSKEEIDLDFSFTLEDFDYDISEFMSLNDTDELKIKFEVSFTYAYVYTYDFEITIRTELD